MSTYKDRPNVIPWPPIIYIAAAIAAYGLSVLVPIPDASRQLLGNAAFYSGLAVSVAGLGLVIWAAAVMKRHKTTILPHQAATHLVSQRPFSFSRNPIYLGDTILLIGLGPIFSNMWFLPAAFLAAFAIHHLVIVREEAHLAAVFEKEWFGYKSAVPRWLGWPRSS